MINLITKLESINVGSIYLDGLVADKLGWHSKPHPNYQPVEKIHWSPPDDWGGGPWGTPLPHYTTDIYMQL